MNGILEDYDEAIAEDYDESFDDESYDEPSEDLLGTIGNVLTGGLPAIASGIGNLVGNAIRPQPSRPPLPRVSVPAPSQGVTSAQLNTPAGSATIALPSPLVRQDEFRTVTDRLQAGINRNTSRLNTVTGDVGRLRSDFVRVETDTRAQVTKMRTDTRNALAKSRREQAAVLAKLRKDQSSQQMTNLMITMMMQRQIQDQLNTHSHSIDPHSHLDLATQADPTKGNVALAANAPGAASGSDNSFLLMLPLMMMQDSGSSSDNMMLPMMMMFAFR